MSSRQPSTVGSGYFNYAQYVDEFTAEANGSSNHGRSSSNIQPNGGAYPGSSEEQLSTDFFANQTYPPFFSQPHGINRSWSLEPAEYTFTDQTWFDSLGSYGPQVPISPLLQPALPPNLSMSAADIIDRSCFDLSSRSACHATPPVPGSETEVQSTSALRRSSRNLRSTAASFQPPLTDRRAAERNMYAVNNDEALSKVEKPRLSRSKTQSLATPGPERTPGSTRKKTLRTSSSPLILSQVDSKVSERDKLFDEAYDLARNSATGGKLACPKPIKNTSTDKDAIGTVCGKLLNNPSHAVRHWQSKAHGIGQYACMADKCGKVFTRIDSLKKHASAEEHKKSHLGNGGEKI